MCWFHSVLHHAPLVLVLALQLAGLWMAADAILDAISKATSYVLVQFYIIRDDRLGPLGIRLYRYLPGFLHQKALICADLAYVGTANLDNRSLRINFELTAAIAGPEFAREAARMMERDMSRSSLVEQGEFDRRSVCFRFGSRLARPQAPIR